MTEERWCMAVVAGKCRHCGAALRREAKVNMKGWGGDGPRPEEPIPFGYMGDCGSCGKCVGGEVEWPFMWVGEI